jgi:uncharacterized protein YbbC (DUF1343 family)
MTSRRVFIGFVVVVFALVSQIPQANAKEGPEALAARQERVVLTGLDVLEREGFERLKGQKLALIANHSALNRRGDHLLDLLLAAEGIEIVSLLSPEHGFRGTEDTHVADGVHVETGLPLYSLYGQTQRPTDQMLEGVQTIVFDMQDIGARFYTYHATMGKAMEEAGKRGIRFVVLDRPNPMGGFYVDGPIQDDEFIGRNTAYAPMPVAHGMTMGELAQFFVKHLGVEVDLEVVAMEGWDRHMFFDECGLPWVNPSPNMRSVEECILYTFAGLTETSTTGLSVGRGTDRPFEYFGAPWVDAEALTAELRKRDLPGMWIMPMEFMPYARDINGKEFPYKYPNTEQACGGIRVVVNNRWTIRPVEAGIHLIDAMYRLYPEEYKMNLIAGSVGARWVLDDIRAGVSPAEIVAKYKADPKFQEFLTRREAVLLY